MSKEETRGAVRSIITAKNIKQLAETFGAIEHGKRTKRHTAREYSQLIELAAKKEALLYAQGKR